MKTIKVKTCTKPNVLKAEKTKTFVTRSEKRTNALIAKLTAEHEKKAAKAVM